MKRVLVTGAAGFIGSHTVRALEQEGYEVLAIDRNVVKLSDLDCKNKEYCDLAHPREVLHAFQRFQPDTVIHLAAQSSVAGSLNDWVGDVEDNIIGTINVVKACQRYNVERLVYSSSGGTAYGEPEAFPTTENHYLNPISPYGVSKLAAEFYVKMSGISHAILRYSNVYGPGQPMDRESGVVSIFIGKALQKKPYPIFNSELHVRDYVFISDVVRANMLVALNPNNGVFNIGTGIGTSVDKVASEISRILGYDNGREYFGARTGEIQTIRLSYEKARAVLGWEPTISFEEGLEITIKSFLQGAGAADRSHNPVLVGSTPTPATMEVSDAI